MYIRCDRNLTKLIIEVLPGIKWYVTKEGTLYCHLLKALYGCVQASKLWYDKLTKFLRTLGYEHLPTDPCVMHKIVNDEIYLLVIYVDDILVLVLANGDEIEHLRQAFTAEYQWFTMEVGNSHSYLGMHLVMNNGYAGIDMSIFVDQLLEKHGDQAKEANTPAAKDIFTVDTHSQPLIEAERREFHTTVAKLLY